MIITIFLAVVAILYLLQILVLRIGLEKADRAKRVEGYEPTVSIIVAARNEEQYVHECLQSLLAIDYPREKLEIIIVNDGSTDHTAEIVQGYIRARSWMKILTTKPGKGNLLGKTNAVAQGIEASHGEILMFTDADCRVPTLWVRETVKYFENNIGIVGGFTLLNASRMFEGIQALDWVFLFGLASATAGWNKPLTAIGNNLSVRRLTYDATGGYGHISFSVTEDYALVQSIITKTDYRVAFPVNQHAVVRSRACQNLKQLFRQKQRWGVGGLDIVLHGMIIMSIGWLLRVLLLLSPFFVNTPVIIAASACMCFIDLRFLWKPLKQFGVLSYLKYFLLFELYFLVYVPLIPIVAFLSKDVVWKERRL